ncbi:MAG: BatD family protein [Prevotellaceae bacterium]|jgi:hypothetical protein|nr:BatD family protein [Prevotellaceae bacterium]
MEKNIKFKAYRLVLFLGLFFILPNAVVSQVIFNAEAPNLVSVGELFNFTLSANINGRVAKPDFSPGFMELASRNGMSIYQNGNKVEQTITYTFTLQALNEGKFTINEATITDESGNTYKTKPVTIEVIKGQAQPQQNPSQGSSPATNNNTSSSNMFMRFIPSRTSLYKGDNLTLTLKFYCSQVEFDRFSGANLPKFDGFWNSDITPDPNSANAPKWQRENIDGRIYNTIIVKIWTLSPQKNGAIKIDAATATAVIRKQTRRTFFFDDYAETQQSIKTPSITINVKDLPSGAPSSFTGAVGNYTMTAKLSKDKVTANDAVSVNVKINGTGNFNLIGAPHITFPHDFETYDSNKTISANSVNFEYQLVPRSAGTFTIDPVMFSYFNPSEEKYVTLTSNPMVIEVEKDLSSPQQVSFVNPTNQRDVQILASDIRFIKNKPETWQSKGSRFLGLKSFYPLYIIAVILFLAIYFLLYKRNKNLQNVIMMRNRKAKGIAKKRLKIAEKSMKLNNVSDFYDELLKAIWGYISDKFLLPVAELSRNNVSELLAEKCVEQKHIDQLISIVDECEFARYAPGVSSSQMHLLYNNTIEVMSKLEQKTK